MAVKKEKKIEVLKMQNILMKAGKVKTRCEMSDGSVWDYNIDSGWKLVHPAPSAMTKLFHEFIEKNEGK